MPEQIFKVTAQDDVVYISAFNLEDAKQVFASYFGDVPDFLTRWTLVDCAPDDDEVLR